MRLPSHIKPLAYNLQLTLPDSLATSVVEKEEYDFGYEGQVDVELSITSPTSSTSSSTSSPGTSTTTTDETDVIILHSVDLTITSAVLKQGKEEWSTENIVIDKANEICKFVFANGTLAKAGSNPTLSVKFKGTIEDKLVGLYRSSYFVNGEKRFMATTQFEATDARRCFPCWDEPALKATFKVTLVVRKNLTAISNMPVEEEKDVENTAHPGIPRKRVTYQTTPLMSTYLLAFIVGELEFVEGKTKEGIPVRCYTTPGKKSQATFSLKVAVESLSFFGEYFDMPYPLPKLDMLAIPDFSAGAMENFGAVTYREIAILIDEANSSAGSKQNVAITVAHELAHQWFGNIVTMEWWTDLWLNEGFATWISYLAIDEQFPDWDIWTQFVYTDYASALKLDAMRSSHPIEVEVKTSGEINEIFDIISYSKGSAVIRLLDGFLGKTDFRNGLRLYLKRHQFKNAQTIHLWQALGEASGKPVEKVMYLYTKHTGYPLVTVTETTKASDTERSFTLSQERFLLDDASKTDSTEEKITWYIPISITCEGLSKPHEFIMTEKTHSFTLPSSVGKNAWIKFNSNQTGFYRVHYPTEMLSSLASFVEKSLKSGSKKSDLALTASDRLGIVSDVFAIAKKGLIPTSQFLTFSLGFVDETDYNVWSDLSSIFYEIASVWSNDDKTTYKSLCNFALQLFSPLAKRCNYFTVPEKESHLDSMLRSLAVGAAAHFGDAEVVSKGKNVFSNYLSGSQTLHPDLRSVVYGLVASHGGETEFNQLKNIYETSELHEEKVRALSNLGYTPHLNLINDLMNYSLSDKVRTQDCIFPFRALARNENAGEIVWKFVQEHWEELDKRFNQGNMSLIGRIISSATAGFASKQKADEIESFFKTRPVPSAERTIQQCIEKIISRAQWLEREKANMKEFLSKY